MKKAESFARQYLRITTTTGIDFYLFEIKAEDYHWLTAAQWEKELFRQLKEYIESLEKEGRLDANTQNSQDNLSQETIDVIEEFEKVDFKGYRRGGMRFQFKVNPRKCEVRASKDKQGKSLLPEYINILDNLCKKETSYPDYRQTIDDRKFAKGITTKMEDDNGEQWDDDDGEHWENEPGDDEGYTHSNPEGREDDADDDTLAPEENTVAWCGLDNKDDTNVSFSNANIQAIAIAFFPLKSFKQLLTSEKSDQAYRTNQDSERVALARSFVKIMDCLDLSKNRKINSEKGQEEATQAIATFRECFNTVDEHMAIRFRDHALFAIGTTHDAFTFLVYLWNLLSDIFPVESIRLSHTLSCDACSATSILQDKKQSNTLSLNIPNDKECITMTELLFLNLYIENVDTSCTSCSKCNGHRRVSSNIQFMKKDEQQQLHLVLHLKRDCNSVKTSVTFRDDSGTFRLYDSKADKYVLFRVEAIIAQSDKCSNNKHYFTVGRKGTYNDNMVKFDNGVAFRNLLLNGKLLPGKDGNEEVSNDAYGYLYFLVEVKALSSSSNNNDAPWCGLANGGKNVCFSNAIVQAFAIAFLSLKSFKDLLTKANIDIVFVNETIRREFAHSFLEVMNCLDLSHTHINDYANSKKTATIAIQNFRRSFKNVQEDLQKKGSKDDIFNEGEQHDAYLFLVLLFKLLEQVIPQFSFHVNLKFKCTCGQTREAEQIEPTHCLSLGFSKDIEESVSMSSLISREYIISRGQPEPEDLCDTICEGCANKKYNQLRSIEFTEHSHLVIHLKRYSNPNDKIFTRVTFPDSNGELTIYDAKSQRNFFFRVEAIIVHAGKNTKSGHYWMVGKKGTYNDLTVTFDNGVQFKKLLSDGVLRHRQDNKEDRDNDAYGYIYFLVKDTSSSLSSSSSSSSSTKSKSSSSCSSASQPATVSPEIIDLSMNVLKKHVWKPPFHQVKMCACDRTCCGSIDVSKQGEQYRCHQCDRKANKECIKGLDGKDGLSLPTCVQCIQKGFDMTTIRDFVPVDSKVLAVEIRSWNYECQSMQTKEPCKNIATCFGWQWKGGHPYSIFCCNTCWDNIRKMSSLSLDKIESPREHDLETLVKLLEHREQCCSVGCGKDCTITHTDKAVCVVCNDIYGNHTGVSNHGCKKPKKTAGEDVRAMFIEEKIVLQRSLLRQRLPELKRKREDERIKVFENHQVQEYTIPPHKSFVPATIESWNYECQSMQTKEPCKNIATRFLWQWIGRRPCSIVCCDTCNKAMPTSLDRIEPPREHDLEILVKLLKNLLEHREQCCSVGCGKDCTITHTDKAVCVVCEDIYENHTGHSNHGCKKPKKTAGEDARAMFVEKHIWDQRSLLRKRVATIERARVIQNYKAENARAHDVILPQRVAKMERKKVTFSNNNKIY